MVGSYVLHGHTIQIMETGINESSQRGHGSFTNFVEKLVKLNDQKDTRNKTWVAFRCTAPEPIDMGFMKMVASKNVCTELFLVAAKGNDLWLFRKCKAVDLAKIKRLAMPDGFNFDVAYHSFPRQSHTNAKLAEVIHDVTLSASLLYGTLLTKSTSDADAPDWEAVLGHIERLSMAEYRAFVANARICRSNKAANALQRAVLACLGNCDEFMGDMQKAYDCIIKAASKHISYPSGFSAKVAELELRLFNHVTKTFYTKSLGDYVNGGLSLTHFLWIVGCSGAGKSTLARALGQEFAFQCEQPSYCFASGYDVVGSLTRAHQNVLQGCFCYDDCSLTSQNRIPMTTMHVLSLVNLQRTGSYESRYALAQLPPGIPRMATMNAGGVNPVTHAVDYGKYFDDHGISVLARMARKDEEWMQAGFRFAMRCVPVFPPRPSQLTGTSASHVAVPSC